MMALVKTLIIIALFCCVNGTLAQQTTGKQNTGSISGHITIGGSPAPNTVVILTQFDPTGMMQLRAGRHQKALAKTTTDGDGKFTFNDLPSGSYLLTPASATLIMKDHPYGHGGHQIHLGEGNTIEDIRISLVRGGVITGRVTDSEERPLIAESVNLHQVFEDGKPRQVQIRDYSMAETDDRGIYRLYGLPPGRYRVSAGQNQQWMGLGRVYYERTFHPDESDEYKAPVIEVTAGSEATAIDIKLGKAAKTFYLSGRVVYADTGEPVDGALCGFGISDPISNQLSNTMFRGRTDKAGTFRLSNLKPGKYLAFSRFEGSSDYYSEVVPFKIVSENIEGIEIRLHRGLTISGVVVIEGTDDPEILAKVSEVQIRVSAADDLRLPVIVSSNQIAPDGSFRISGIKTGKIRLSPFLFPPQNNIHPIRIERDGVNCTDGIEVAEGAAVSNIRIVMLYANGRVRGQVQIESGVMPEGSRFHVLIRSLNTDSLSSRNTRPIELDQRGRFEAKGIIPGEYSIDLFLRTRSAGYRVTGQTVTVTNNIDTEVVLVVDTKTINKEQDR